LTAGVVKRSRLKLERHIAPTGKMVNVYITFLAVKDARVHFQEPGEVGKTVLIWVTKQIPLDLITNSVRLTKLSSLNV
jgi:hypothetical protein